MASRKVTFYQAAILNPKSDTKCDYFPQGLLVVKTDGKKSRIQDLLELNAGKKKYKHLMNSKNTVIYKNSVIMPTFFDMHFHWVQDDVRQMPKDSLLEWLEKYTFPTESKYANKAYAQKKAKTFFRRLVKTGTLGGACYSSIHEHAIEAAMDEVVGDFVIGNVLMNMNSPKALTQTEDQSLQLTRKLIGKFQTRHAFTPRFAITTTPKVMKEGAKLADKSKCFKQTHLSETPGEIDFVLSLYKKIPGFEDVKSYTDIYKKTGMLGKRSLMGHGIHLNEHELKVLNKSKTALIHCPTSNAPITQRGLGSGLFNFKKVEKAKVRWALGSDIGGGPFLSMFDVMRSFVSQNKNKEATYVKGLYRATLAGAEILRLDKRHGNLNPKKEANFIVTPMPKKKFSSAEALLKSLIVPHQKKRDVYDQLVSSVVYRGKKLF